MSVIAELQLKGFIESQLPDNLAESSDCLSASDDFVISRKADGTVLSRYRDDKWDMKPYDAQGRCVFNFSSWCSDPNHPLAQLIQAEMKRIQVVRLHWFPRPRKVNSVPIVNLRKLGQWAFNNRITLHELFNNKEYRFFLLASYAELPAKPMGTFLELVKELFDFRSALPAFEFAPAHYEVVRQMDALWQKHPKSEKEWQQTRLIPTRLYASIISILSEELDAFNRSASGILRLFEERAKDKYFARSEAKRQQKKDSPVWTEAIDQLGLSALLTERSITGFKSLYSYLIGIQSAAKYWIHFFTGMRDNEGRYLPANSYSQFNAGETSISVMRGYTSKVGGQNHTPTFWITSPIIEKAVAAARSIGRVYALTHGWDDSDPSQYPLFPAQRQSERAGKHHYTSVPVVPANINRAVHRIFEHRPIIAIQEGDIRELELLDGFRDWRAERDIDIGKPWPLTTHQCRRSLAVYSARSGMVSLGALAVQYKHLTELMTSYYRKDQAFAINFVETDDQRQLIEEIEQECRLSAFAQYEESVINTSSRLWGGEGNRIQVARDKGEPLIITSDRKVTEKKFQKGEMSYKRGPLGGCTNLEACEKISFTSIFACLDCEKAILDHDRSLRNIERGLRNLKRGRALFDPSNPHYLQLTMEIDAVNEKLERRGLLDLMEQPE